MNKGQSADIEAIKHQSRKSGLTYNEAKEYIARTTGGKNTYIYSDTDQEAVKQKNEVSQANLKK